MEGETMNFEKKAIWSSLAVILFVFIGPDVLNIANQFNPVFLNKDKFHTHHAFAQTSPLTAKEAIEKARKDNKYLFLIFYNTKDNFYHAMKKELDAYKTKNAKDLYLHDVLMTNEKDAEIIYKYRVRGAPLPLLLVIAPNGAVTGGFPQKASAEQLDRCFPSNLVLRMIKSIQDGRKVLILLKNNKTKNAAEMVKNANAALKDPMMNGTADLFIEDPTNPKNADFLAQCNLSQNMTETTIVAIVPPGRISGIFTGTTSKETLVAALSHRAGDGCCP